MKREENQQAGNIIDWEKIHLKLKSNEGSLLKKVNPDSQEKKIILKKRADRLAKESKNDLAAQEKIEVLSFQIELENYGIEVEFINKVYLLKDLTPLPKVSPFIIGIINVRGHIVPVIDFRKIFELPKDKNVTNEKVIVVSTFGSTYGLLADEVTGLESVLVNNIQHELPTLSGARVEFLKGITHQQMVILDPTKIAAHKSIVMNDEI